MAITNQLCVKFNYEEIDKKYDFYIFTTTDKFIRKDAHVLDKPKDYLKADSIVFDNGRSLFVMFRKSDNSYTDFVNIFANEDIYVEQKKAANIKDYILFRLFLYSINNFDGDLKFNNLTGKFFITKSSWKKNKKSFKALAVNVDIDMNISAQATSFNSISFFDKKDIYGEPMYSFSHINSSLKRVFNEQDVKSVFVRKPLPEQKVEIPFLNLSVEKLKDNKAYYIYYVIELVNEKYKGLLNADFKKVDVSKSIDKFRDELFMQKALDNIKKRRLYFSSFVMGKEFEKDFYKIANYFNERKIAEVLISDDIKSDGNNIVYIHNQKYYQKKKYNDPYKSFSKNNVIQCITVEDSSGAIICGNKKIFNTIIKEIVIKNDILNEKKFSLDDWSSYNFKNNWIIGKEKDLSYYFMIIKPDGSFEFKKKENNLLRFNDHILDSCVAYLSKNSGKEKTIILYENNVNIISRTTQFILPSKELFNLDTVSRNKESRKKYLDGIVDINCFNINDDFYYTAGARGRGMKEPLPKASLLYKCDILFGKNLIYDILETMAVSFVRYNSFTVLPYPIKYLNEYILMMESENNK